MRMEMFCRERDSNIYYPLFRMTVKNTQVNLGTSIFWEKESQVGAWFHCGKTLATTGSKKLHKKNIAFRKIVKIVLGRKLGHHRICYGYRPDYDRGSTKLTSPIKINAESPKAGRRSNSRLSFGMADTASGIVRIRINLNLICLVLHTALTSLKWPHQGRKPF